MSKNIFAPTDKILRSRGLKHLLSAALLQREESISRELTALRGDILGRRYLKTHGHVAFEQVKKRTTSATLGRVTRIAFRRVGAGAVHVDMTAEHDARRRERLLAAELAAIDTLWHDRRKALATK